ncbi:MAG: hypothetical protein ACOCP2_04360 [Halohasta sp.]
MKRRTLLTHAGAGMATLGAMSMAGCSSDDGNGDDGNGDDGNGDGDSSEPLPELTLSDQTVRSTIDELPIAGQQAGLRRGQRHDDIHFAVTLSVTNEGDQRIDLDDYGYELDLYDDAGNDITLGDTWASDGDTLDPDETGSVIVEESFIDSEATPEDVDSYRAILGCGSSSSAYCD